LTKTSSKSTKKAPSKAPVKKSATKAVQKAVVQIHSFDPTFYATMGSACKVCGLKAHDAKSLHYNAVEKLALRECPQTGTHTPHEWKSYSLGAGGVLTWCRGTGQPALSYSTTYTPKPKKHYPLPEGEERLTVPAARKIAFDMHKGQKDKSNEPYHFHLEAVRMGVVVLGGDDEVQIAALFHDAVEDLCTTYEILKEAGVTERSLKAIEAVTKRSSEEQGVYLERIVAAGPDAMRVKVADLLHNTRHDRLAALPQATRDRLLKKYRPALARLLLELNMIVDEDAQKKLATKPQGSSYGTYTGSGSTGKGTSYTIGSLFKGDWPSAWKAPILAKVGSTTKDITFLLANGEIRTEALKTDKGALRSLYTYTFEKWTTDNKITFSGVSEEELLSYMNVINDSKTA
jgi:hypothetical protein